MEEDISPAFSRMRGEVQCLGDMPWAAGRLRWPDRCASQLRRLNGQCQDVYHNDVIYITSMELTALVLSLPARNSTVRMRVWRALKETGSGVLRDGVYVLPKGEGGALAAVEADIKAAGGFAMTMDVKLKNGDTQTVRRLFDRGADYAALSRRIRDAQGALGRLGTRKGRTLVSRVERAFEKLRRIDYFPGEAGAQAAHAIAVLKEAHAAGEPRASRKTPNRPDPAKFQGRVWATREDPWVDRLASAWLIRRFIDREARFAWITSPRELPKRAVGFDFDGAQFTHSKDRVTFEVLLASFGLERDPALAFIGALVHFLDVGGIPVAEAKGLETMLAGVKSKAKNDDELLRESLKVFDLLHAGYSQPA